MEFSGVFEHSKFLSYVSPDAALVASAFHYKVHVRDVKDLQVYRLYTCLDTVDKIGWSPDSLLIACAMLKRNIIQVWHLESNDWQCKIDEGSIGFTDIFWAPDARHILTVAKFNLRITVWSLLEDNSIAYIKHPKKVAKPIEFSRDGRYLAVLERHAAEDEDQFSILDCHGEGAWRLESHFNINLQDCSSFIWSTDCETLICLDNFENHSAAVYNKSGVQLALIECESSTIGINLVDCTLTGQFVALGDFKGRINILNHLSWSSVAQFDTAFLQSLDSNLHELYVEMSIPYVDGYAVSEMTSKTKYEIMTKTVSLKPSDADWTKRDGGCGVQMMKFSPNCKYLAAVVGRFPHVIYIWSMTTMTLSVALIHRHRVSSFIWHPRSSQLVAITQEGERLYTWSEKCAQVVPFPMSKADNDASAAVKSGIIDNAKLEYSNDGSTILAKTRNGFVAIYQ